MALNCPNPIVIIKDPIVRADKKEGWYRFAVCYDGSEKARNALKVVLGMMSPNDKVVIITCKEANIKLEAIESSCISLCAEMNCTTMSFVQVEREAGQNVYKAIQRYLIDESAKDNYVDFVACGNQGVNYGKNKSTSLGSVANMVVRAKRMNVIFCP